MGQVCHGSATTTHAVRAAIQRSQASFAQLSRELGQPQDGGKVAQARDGRGHEDRADGTAVDGADRGRGGDIAEVQTAEV